MDAHVHEIWKEADPEEWQRLCREDPKHERLMAEGWSWIDCYGGPKDGTHQYFHGSPEWETYFVDPANEGRDYKAGDPVHCYRLACGVEGHAIYLYHGTDIEEDDTQGSAA